jgi:hypothetical protein
MIINRHGYLRFCAPSPSCQRPIKRSVLTPNMLSSEELSRAGKVCNGERVVLAEPEQFGQRHRHAEVLQTRDILGITARSVGFYPQVEKITPACGGGAGFQVHKNEYMHLTR